MKGRHFRRKGTLKKLRENEVGDYSGYSYQRLFYLALFFFLAVISVIWCYIEVSSPWLS